MLQAFYSTTCIVFSAPYISLEIAHCPICICFVFLSTRVRCSFYLCTLPISELSDFHFEENCDNKNTIANKLQANIGGSTEFLCELTKYLKLFSIHTDLEVFPGIQVLFVEDLIGLQQIIPEYRGRPLNRDEY